MKFERLRTTRVFLPKLILVSFLLYRYWHSNSAWTSRVNFDNWMEHIHIDRHIDKKDTPQSSRLVWNPSTTWEIESAYVISYVQTAIEGLANKFHTIAWSPDDSHEIELWILIEWKYPYSYIGFGKQLAINRNIHYNAFLSLCPGQPDLY